LNYISQYTTPKPTNL